MCSVAVDADGVCAEVLGLTGAVVGVASGEVPAWDEDAVDRVGVCFGGVVAEDGVCGPGCAVVGVAVCDRGGRVAGERGFVRTIGAGGCCGTVSSGTCAWLLAVSMAANAAKRRKPACRVGVKGQSFSCR